MEKNSKDKPEWITTTELARRWSTSSVTVRRYANQGLLPHIAIGKTKRFDWNLLSDLVKKNYPLAGLER